uniref:G_PROTEIN_RECEP_F3_4 domain-containing protein n=1 Tax=Heterorhabditis bacteriophora TaxID=37862 RepID=A0A1I7X4H7_HETBA
MRSFSPCYSAGKCPSNRPVTYRLFACGNSSDPQLRVNNMESDYMFLALNNCLEIRKIVTDPIYIIPSFLASGAGLLAVVMALYAIVLFVKKSYFHINVKILLGLLLVACLLFSASNSFATLYIIANIFLYDNSCSFFDNNSFCYYFRRILMIIYLGNDINYTQ